MNPTDPAASLLPSVVRSWIGDPEADSIRPLEATVLSVDITGFTRLADDLSRSGPRQAGEALTDAINRCFEPMIDAAIDHGGDILKFGGDAMFILFDDEKVDQAVAASEAAASAPVRACHAAARMQQLIGSVDVGTGQRLSMTAGVATGPFRLVLPPTRRRELLVYGAAVDAALQLEADAEPGEVLIDDATADAVAAAWVDRSEPDATLLVIEEAGADLPADTVWVSADSPAALSLSEREIGLGPDLAAAIDAFDGTSGELRTVVLSFVQLPTTNLDDQEVLAAIAVLDELCTRYGTSVIGIDVDRGGVKILLAAGVPVAVGGDEDSMLATVTEFVGNPAVPPTRAAINRGVVYAGFLGSSRCRSFTTMGDTTNLAARLLAKAEMGSLVATQGVLDHARDTYESTELPPVLVRGRVDPVVVHRVGALTGDWLTGVERPAPPFVGRADELAQLQELMSVIRQGRGAFVEVRGEAGIGASRLIDELVASPAPGTLLFRINARLAASSKPFDALQPMLRAVAGITAEQAALGPGDVGRQLHEWVQRTAPDQLALLPLGALAFGAESAPTEESAAIAPEFVQRTGNDVVAALMSAALTVPTVIVMEDAQWLDDASRDLLARLGPMCAELPWLIVTTSRPTSPRLSIDSRGFDLPPLELAAAEQIVAAVSDLPDGTHREIARLSGGNPLFAVELALADDLGQERPDSIEALITSQIDGLGHDARVLIRTGAVLGQQFPVSLLEAVLDRPLRSELKAIDLFQIDDSSDLAGDESVRVTFRSGIIHEVAYAGLPNRRRRELHAAVAAVLEESGTAELADLARHHAAAGNDRAAWDYGRRAAAAARDMGLLHDAFGHLSAAVGAADALVDEGGSEPVEMELLTEALVELFELGLATGERAEAIAFGARAIEALDDPVERARMAGVVAAETAAHDGSYQVQADRLQILLAESGEGDNAQGVRAWIGAYLCGLLFRTTAWDEALDVATAAAADAAVTDLAAPRAMALGTRLIVLSNRADPARLAARDEVIAAAELVGDGMAVVRAHNNVGTDLERSGEWTGAIRHYNLAAAAAQKRGDVDLELIPSLNYARLLGQQGHWDQARSVLDDVRRRARHQRARFIEAHTELELGKLEVAAGRATEGRRWLSQCRAFFDPAGNQAALYEVDLSEMAADLAEGRSEAVLAAAESLVVPADRESDVIGRAERLVAYARMQRGEHEEALAIAGQGVEIIVDDNQFGRALGLIARSEAEAFLGRTRTARRSRETADAILDVLDVRAIPSVPLPK